MKKLLVGLLFLVLSAFTVNTAQATTLGFDDITPDENTKIIENGYNGFNWNNLRAIRQDYYSYGGYHDGVISPDYAVFNGSGNDASISATGGTFNFVSAYFSAAWYDGLNIDVTGYRNGSAVHNYSFTVDTANSHNGQISPISPLLVTFNFDNIDTLTFHTSGGTQVYDIGEYRNHQLVMDNFTFTGNPAPEPTTILLGFLGLGGLAFIRRKKLT
jgi:hypothetical protein